MCVSSWKFTVPPVQFNRWHSHKNIRWTLLTDIFTECWTKTASRCLINFHPRPSVPFRSLVWTQGPHHGPTQDSLLHKHTQGKTKFRNSVHLRPFQLTGLITAQNSSWALSHTKDYLLLEWGFINLLLIPISTGTGKAQPHSWYKIWLFPLDQRIPPRRWNQIVSPWEIFLHFLTSTFFGNKTDSRVLPWKPVKSERNF